MRALARVAALALAAAVPGSVMGQEGAPQAPLLLPQMPLHDPFIVADKATRTYWLFTRNEAGLTGDKPLGIMAYSSRDLKHWTRPRVVFTLPEGHWADGGAWAPEVHQWRGRYYLFATFHNEAAKLPATGNHKPYRRGTLIAMGDRPEGPYRLANDGEPVAPKELMTLDGTLHVEPDGRPWYVYAHEWLQVGNGTIEALPLTPDLKQAGEPRLLFKASEADWAKGQPQPNGENIWVTDGPELFRTRTGRLMMLWSSYGERGYVQALARSKSGRIEGPWEQLGPLVTRDSGHGMMFRTFDDKLMMVLHRPFKYALGKLYEMRDDGDRVSVVREAVELDLEAYPTHPCLIDKSPTGQVLSDC